MRSRLFIAGAFAAQIVIVAVMLGMAVEPLWTGREIKIEVQAVDPRDLLRGDYARLSYPFNLIRLDSVDTDIDLGMKIGNGQELFVVIDESSNDGDVRGLYTTAPDSLKYLTGRSSVSIQTVDTNETIWLDFGVEKFFTSPEDAKSIEQDILNDSTVVVTLMVNSSGRARIKSISAGSGP